MVSQHIDSTSTSIETVFLLKLRVQVGSDGILLTCFQVHIYPWMSREILECEGPVQGNSKYIYVPVAYKMQSISTSITIKIQNAKN